MSDGNYYQFKITDNDMMFVHNFVLFINYYSYFSLLMLTAIIDNKVLGVN